MAEPPRVDDPTPTWNPRERRVARMEFDASLSSPRRTRVFVGSTARGWGLGDVGVLAELLVSEVVTNAVEHGSSGGAVEIIALPTGLRVEVTDQSLGLPELRNPSATEPTGRGLSIVDQLSRWWGVERATDGKKVWFEVDDLDVSRSG